MSKIIEKLGLKTPDELNVVGDVWKVYELAGLPRPHVSNDLFFEQGSTIKRLLDGRNEMLERDIMYIKKLEDEIKFCEFCGMDKAIEGLRMALDYFDLSPDQKATGKTWSEIKELL